MDEFQLGQLRDQLLASGVAPRHVKRTVRELRDHRSDLMEHLCAGGMEYGSAALEAATRLGSVETLVNAVLERPELCSFSRRYPAFVFVLLPALLYVALTLTCVFTIFSYVGHHFAESPLHLPAEGRLFVAETLSFARIAVEWGLPCLLAVYFAQLAAQRHVRSWWFAIGAVLIAELGSIPIVSLDLSTTDGTVTGGIDLNSEGFHWLTWRALALAVASVTTYSLMLGRNSLRLRQAQGMSLT